MSAGFFITAKNKLGLVIQSDGTSSDYDSDEERENARRERILARRKPDPLKTVFDKRDNVGSHLPSPNAGIKKAKLVKDQKDPDEEKPIFKLNWDRHISESRAKGLILSEALETEEERRQTFKFKCERKYRFSMKPDKLDDTNLDDYDYALLHDGMKKTDKRARLGRDYTSDINITNELRAKAKPKKKRFNINTPLKPVFQDADELRNVDPNHKGVLPFAIRKAGLEDNPPKEGSDSSGTPVPSPEPVRDCTPPPPSLEDLLGPGGLPKN